MPPKMAATKLTKRQKAEKYGKKYKRDYLLYNKEILGGDMALFKEEEERKERILKQLVDQREAADPSVKAYLRKKKAGAKDNLNAFMGDKAVVLASLNISRHSHDLDLLRRRSRAVRAKADSLSGYVTVLTTLGTLHFEVYADRAPTAAENFLGLCRRGYYDGVSFHRLVKGFVLQGGDPTKTGAGGESLWGPAFQDECHPHLSHDARGVLSMANGGPHSNTSQFYITLAPCTHLDGKHTIFGRLAGGMPTLSLLEDVPTGIDDRPIKEVRIEKTFVHWDPFDFFTEK
ncbi:Peptidyl-prolyl cis-trans isomerase CYP65 [Diplonema papillatum]|nr:Peptidyl-prolyl cis-trans isomerase CYP65 [Diplonema papillatum]WGM49995.1 PPIL1B [Diplonema papillatum]